VWWALEFSDVVRRHVKRRLRPVFRLQAVEPFVKELSHRFLYLMRPFIARFSNPGGRGCWRRNRLKGYRVISHTVEIKVSMFSLGTPKGMSPPHETIW